MNWPAEETPIYQQLFREGVWDAPYVKLPTMINEENLVVEWNKKLREAGFYPTYMPDNYPKHPWTGPGSISDRNA